MRGICLVLVMTTGSAALANAAFADEAKIVSPSFVYVGKAEAAAPAAAKVSGTSTSIIALGEPGVEDIKVAAVSQKSHPSAMPMVIRGGVIGSAFTAPPAAAVALPPTDAAAPAADPAVAAPEPAVTPTDNSQVVNADPEPTEPPAKESNAQQPAGVSKMQ